LQQYLRDAILVPESKTLGALLRDFQQKKSHMAIVMDGVLASSAVDRGFIDGVMDSVLASSAVETGGGPARVH
jgi:Mg2+/Co2+ transporter CorC